MKKFLTIIAAVAFAAQVYAGMEAVKYSSSVPAAEVKTNTYVLRGLIEAIHVDFTSTYTGTVAVVDDYGTIFSKASIVADTLFFPMFAGQTSAGATLTVGELGTINSVAATNTVTSPIFKNRAVAGAVSVVVTGQEAARTNTSVVTIIYDQK